MIFIDKREESMTEKSQSALISNLKGRVSKALTLPSTLKPDEFISLELIYEALDSFILSKKKESDISNLKDALFSQAKILRTSGKGYIKEHIVPLINKVSTRRWDNE